MSRYYTEDFDQEMLDWLANDRPKKCHSRLPNIDRWTTKHKYLKLGATGDLWTSIGDAFRFSSYTKLSKSEFKKHIGMPEEETIMQN